MESTTQGSFLLFYTCIISFIPQNDLMRLALLLLFSYSYFLSHIGVSLCVQAYCTKAIIQSYFLVLCEVPGSIVCKFHTSYKSFNLLFSPFIIRDPAELPGNSVKPFLILIGTTGNSPPNTPQHSFILQTGITTFCFSGMYVFQSLDLDYELVP